MKDCAKIHQAYMCPTSISEETSRIPTSTRAIESLINIASFARFNHLSIMSYVVTVHALRLLRTLVTIGKSSKRIQWHCSFKDPDKPFSVSTLRADVAEPIGVRSA